MWEGCGIQDVWEDGEAAPKFKCFSPEFTEHFRSQNQNSLSTCCLTESLRLNCGFLISGINQCEMQSSACLLRINSHCVERARDKGQTGCLLNMWHAAIYLASHPTQIITCRRNLLLLGSQRLISSLPYCDWKRDFPTPLHCLETGAGVGVEKPLWW